MSKKAFRILTTVLTLVAILALTVNFAEARNRVSRQRVAPPSGSMLRAGGINCASPTVVGTPTWSDSDNTCSGNNTLEDYWTGAPNCETYPYPGPELLYQIDLGTANEVQILLEPQTADLGVFLLSDCTSGLSCVTFFDAVGGGAPSLIAPGQTGVTVPGQPGTFDFAPVSGPGSYYVYVDSYYASGVLSCGSYNLTVTGNLPVELMEFKVE